MFDGKFKGSRIVSAGGKRSASGTDKNALLDNARKQREERLIERQRQHACIKIQSFYRQLSTQRKESNNLNEEKKESNVHHPVYLNEADMH